MIVICLSGVLHKNTYLMQGISLCCFLFLCIKSVCLKLHVIFLGYCFHQWILRLGFLFASTVSNDSLWLSLWDLDCSTSKSYCCRVAHSHGDSPGILDLASGSHLAIPAGLQTTWKVWKAIPPFHASCLSLLRVENEQGIFHNGACTRSLCPFICNAISFHCVTPVLVLVMHILFGLWCGGGCFFVLSTCVLILWVLPFLLLAASRRHSRSTSALSTADSVGQSGEQVLTAWICF